MVYIMVASATKAIDAIRSAGGEIVHQVDPRAREVVATFRDPAGNLIGIYQQPGLAESEAALIGHTGDRPGAIASS
jgi:predicted enzyme related to lactoylglutathione lyase